MHDDAVNWHGRRSLWRGAAVACLVVLATLAGIVASPAKADERISTTATQLLNSLTVAPESNVGYDRGRFRHWITTGGCTTREWVLIRQAIGGKRTDCVVVAGRWFSRYDGRQTSAASTFDVDHLVPLAEAWGSGASAWTDDQRMRYANDLDYRPALIAVSASSNRSKGDRDPAEWMPPTASYRCRYLRQWVGVKFRWGLSVDATEKVFVSAQLVACPAAMVAPATER